MRRHLSLAAAVVASSVPWGCSHVTRSQERYRDDTAALLHTRSGAVTACYNDALAAEPEVGGLVAVRFELEEVTGKLAAPAVEPALTTAPPSLAECVLRSLRGLVLVPPDAHAGDAVFLWEFSWTPPAPKG